MTNEEKKALDKLKAGKKIGIYELIRTFKREGIENFVTTRKEYVDTVLNLIEKQSKEIEELKKPKYIMNFETNEITKLTNEFISKDKIKEILGLENEDDSEEKILTLLKTIVDENARLEDIEDRKVQIEYNNVFNKGVKSVEDKIKAKIKKYDEWLKDSGEYKESLEAQRYALNELLEE